MDAMLPLQVLVVDDDLGMREALRSVLEDEGLSVECASSAAEGLLLLQNLFYPCVLLDLLMPGMSGLEALPQILERQPNTAVIMITAHGTIKTAIEAVRQGAFDFLTKPFELDELRMVLQRALSAHQQSDVATHPPIIFPGVIGTSRIMAQLLPVVAKVAAHDVTVLITGESGTGKELLARAIHENSPRHNGPLVKVNCGAISENLLESELFGHEKGSFTGAYERKIGRFERAQGGTLFLDEIGEMPPPMQIALLRALQEREIERVGGSGPVAIDIRLITATHRNLRKDVESGRFRSDLFYRLNVVPLEMPPLRERAEDIPSLVQHFLNEFNRAFSKHIVTIPSAVEAALCRYPWPGNIRELRNAIERVALLAEGSTLRIDLLPEEIRAYSPQTGQLAADRSLIDMEREHLMNMLKAKNWNQSQAAAALGIHRNTLRRKMEELGLERD